MRRAFPSIPFQAKPSQAKPSQAKPILGCDDALAPFNSLFYLLHPTFHLHLASRAELARQRTFETDVNCYIIIVAKYTLFNLFYLAIPYECMCIDVYVDLVCAAKFACHPFHSLSVRAIQTHTKQLK